MKTLEKTSTIMWEYLPEKDTLSLRQIDNRIKKLAELDAQITRLKREHDAIKQEIIAGLPNDHVITQHYKVNYSTYSQSRIDTTKLKKDLPDIAREYSRETTQSRFTYTEIKS